MEITEVKVTLVDDPKLKAFATITIDGEFVVRGLKIINGRTGTFIAMPARKLADGSWQDIAHPINAETRITLERAVLSVFRDECGRAKQETGDDPGIESTG
jgi:stage V sporulation protein G